MQNLEIDKIYRAWISVDGVPVEAFARPTSVKITDKILSMSFRTGPGEISAIAMGKSYTVELDKETSVRLEAHLPAHSKKRRSILKNIGGDIGWEITDLEGAIAWATEGESSDESIALEILPMGEELLGDQISIEPNGTLEVSKNLIGKTVKVLATIKYARSVLIANEDLEAASGHLVGKWKDGRIRYAEFSGHPLRGVFNAKSQFRQCQLEFASVRVEDLI